MLRNEARQALGALEGVAHSWGQASWSTQRLRDGPDYKRNRIKRPALPPLLPCVGFDAFRTRRKIFTPTLTLTLNLYKTQAQPQP